MTNAQIIFNSSISLMEQGVLKGTGRFIKVATVNEEGVDEVKTIEEPEAIHTYAAWKQLGRQVKKGQKAKAQIVIWKYKAGTKEAEATNEAGETVTIEVDNSKMFQKLSFFFTIDQTEEIKTK